MPAQRRQKGVGIKTLVFALCALAQSAIPVLAAPPPRYEIEAVIDTAKHRLCARQKVTFTNNSAQEISSLYFHIYPHRKYTESEKSFLKRYAAYFKVNPYPEGFQSGDLKINSVSSQGENLAYKIEGQDETILKVDLPKELPGGSSVELELGFDLAIPHSYGRLGWHKDITSLLRWYPILSVLDQAGWHNYPFYPYHQPYFSEAADYRITLTCSQAEVVAHSGSLKNESLNPDGTKTLLIESDFPLRDFGLALSPRYKVVSKETGSVKVNSYYLPGDEFYAQKALESVLDLIDSYTQKFAPYPYKEFNIAPVYLAYGGTQSSNLILIDTRVYRLPKFLIRYFDFMISHETGHQWFYNLVGSDEYREMFIDEGLNSYFILEHLKNKYGAAAGIMDLPRPLGWLIPNFSFERAQLDRYSFVAKNGLDRPAVSELSSFKEPSSIFSIAYGKGSKVIDMLRYVMGEEPFKRMMERYFSEFKFKNISVEDLKGLASQESNSDLGWFFESWLKSSRKCDYAVDSVRSGKVTIKNLGNIPMPADVKVGLADGREIDYRIDGQRSQETFSDAQGARIKSVRIDPDKRILDLDQTNNYWKKKIDFRLIPLYYPIYETPVFLKDDSYSLISGFAAGGADLGIKSSFQKPQDYIFYFSSAYNFDEERVKNTAGFEARHLGGELLKAGLEGFSYNDIHGKADQEGGKLYLRKDLWPASYGLIDDNDHITFYLLRDRDFKSVLSAGDLEDIRNFYYGKENEAIAGINFKIGRYGIYPDPSCGWKLISTLENAGHFMGGENYFWRLSPELTRYFTITPLESLAVRVKLGLGYPDDKGLFQLGGERALRGYSYKTINGSQAFMANLEYRRDLISGLDLRLFWDLACLNKIQGVEFFDCGKSWFNSFEDRSFKKDLGLGLRLHFTLGSFLENFIVRLDAAQPVNDPKAKRHYWLGFSQAF